MDEDDDDNLTWQCSLIDMYTVQDGTQSSFFGNKRASCLAVAFSCPTNCQKRKSWRMWYPAPIDIKIAQVILWKIKVLGWWPSHQRLRKLLTAKENLVMIWECCGWFDWCLSFLENSVASSISPSSLLSLHHLPNTVKKSSLCCTVKTSLPSCRQYLQWNVISIEKFKKSNWVDRPILLFKKIREISGEEILHKNRQKKHEEEQKPVKGENGSAKKPGVSCLFPSFSHINWDLSGSQNNLPNTSPSSSAESPVRRGLQNQIPAKKRKTWISSL